MRYPQIVKKMSLEQKAAFVSGYDYWHLEEAPELGLPKIMITDGPHGLRKAKGKDYVPAEGEERKAELGLVTLFLPLVSHRLPLHLVLGMKTS